MGMIFGRRAICKEKESWSLVDLFFSVHKSKRRYRMLDG
jgi:hypothetical protein